MPELISLAISGIVVTAGIWWVYFAREQPDRLDGLRSGFRFGYLHHVVFAAVGAVSSGVEVELDEITGHTEIPPSTSSRRCCSPQSSSCSRSIACERVASPPAERADAALRAHPKRSSETIARSGRARATSRNPAFSKVEVTPWNRSLDDFVRPVWGSMGYASIVRAPFERA